MEGNDWGMSRVLSPDDDPQQPSKRTVRQYQAEVMFPLLVGGSPGKSKQYLLLAKIFKTLSLTPP